MCILGRSAVVVLSGRCFHFHVYKMTSFPEKVTSPSPFLSRVVNNERNSLRVVSNCILGTRAVENNVKVYITVFHVLLHPV